MPLLNRFLSAPVQPEGGAQSEADERRGRIEGVTPMWHRYLSFAGRLPLIAHLQDLESTDARRGGSPATNLGRVGRPETRYLILSISRPPCVLAEAATNRK